MKKIIITISLLGSIISCSDFLTVEPIEQVSINQQLSNKKGILVALNGAYYDLRSSTIFSLEPYIYADLLSGNLGFSPSSNTSLVGIPTLGSVAGTYNFDYNKTEKSNTIFGFYSGSYELINNLNLILQYVDAIPDATESEKKQIKAEALAMRAFIHFQLYKMYSQNYTYTADASHLGIVYNTAPLKVGIDYPIRKSAAETFSLLESDISTAISLYQNEKAIPAGLERNFISINGAKTIAADIALWKNDWQKAYDYSTDIINNSGLALYPNTVSANDWAQSELIFELANTGEDNSPVSAIYNYTSASDRSNYVASTDLMNLYSTNDKRRQFYESKNLRTLVNGTSTQVPYYFTTKFKYNVNNSVYRLTELYFIRAEAAFHLGNTTQALSDINKIRTRAGIPELMTINIDLLLEEKRREFAFENKSFFDLTRNHKNIVRNIGCISTNCSPTYPNDKFVLPIPQATIDVNSYMQQNPGY